MTSTLIQMQQQFRLACSAIDRQADKAAKQCMADGMALLLKGDTAGRDRMVAKIKGIPEVIWRAKVEAWCRIGEEFGLDRDECEAEAQRILAKERQQ